MHIKVKTIADKVKIILTAACGAGSGAPLLNTTGFFALIYADSENPILQPDWFPAIRICIASYRNSKSNEIY